MAGKILRMRRITRAYVKANRDKAFVFGDNMRGIGLGGQAKAMRGEPNTIGVPTKHFPGTGAIAYFTDEDLHLGSVAPKLDLAFRDMVAVLESGHDVVIPLAGLGSGLAQLEVRAPRIDRCIKARIAELETKYGVSGEV